LILENGDKVGALDKEGGEVQAQLSLALAEIQASLAKKQAHNSLIGGIIGTIGSIFSGAASGKVPGGIGGFLAGAGSTFTAVQNAYAAAAAARAAGQAQATAERRLADIQSQKDRIAAMERSEMQFEAANETELRLAEALHSLALQAERQRLNILLALQKLDLEEAKLSGLLARVNYLLGEYRRAVIFRDQDPSIAPDYRMARDETLSRANDAFNLAQQWSVVAALAFDYKDHRPATEKVEYLSTVLKHRNGQQLGNDLITLQSANANLILTYQNSPATKVVRFSIRNDLFQHNLRTGFGSLDNTNLFDLGYTNDFVFEPTAQGTNSLASNAAWTKFLLSLIVTNTEGRIFSLPFITSLDRSFQAGLQQNPLFDRTLFGLLIFSGKDLNGRQFNGIRVNFVLKGNLEGGPFQGGVRPSIALDLTQQGQSYVRGSAWACDDGQNGLRVFSFKRFRGRVEASINSIDSLEGSDAFQERSPANSRWVLSISSDNAFNNRLLLNNINLVTDIEIQFSLRGFQDQSCF
jgi:hypothetical protein